MLILEVMLVIVGLAAVVLSYKISDYGKGEHSEGMDEPKDVSEKVSSYNIEEMENQMEQLQEESVMKVSDELSRISNEKLMGMDEYSSQVLDKIEKNHSEVVFLYNMLNEKEEEIKKLVHHVDTVKAQLHEDVAKEYQKVSESLKIVENKKEELNEKIHLELHSEKHSEKKVEKSSREELNAMYEMEVEAIKLEEEKEQQYFPKKAEESTKQQKNHNNEIVTLHKKGHSVLEISRMLSLGQGEVKFVIDLFEAK